MKKILKLTFLLGLLCSFTYSCQDDDSLNITDISGLGGDQWEETELDKWLYTTFITNYNIEIKYKWDQYELDLNKTLVPVNESVVQPVMTIVHDAWLKPYENIVGANFIRELAPKRFVLVGSPQYNTNGTIVTGEAEGGRKITLFRLNWFDPSTSNKSLIQAFMKTIHHEFGHTMHQTVMYPEAYMYITPGGYTSSWTNYTDAEAQKLGFISPYAAAGPDEDFVEMLSLIVVYGRANFDAYVAAATAIYTNPATNAGMTYDPGAALRQKEAIVISYLKDVWKIDLYDKGFGGLEEEVQKALATFI